MSEVPDVIAGFLPALPDGTQIPTIPRPHSNSQCISGGHHQAKERL